MSSTASWRSWAPALLLPGSQLDTRRVNLGELLKTLGFSGGRILRMVLGESILLALLGGLPGLGAALLLIKRCGQPDELRPDAITLPRHCGGGGRAMVVFGVITGLVPALNAMRLNIVTALGRS